jgi:hypothetical protein
VVVSAVLFTNPRHGENEWSTAFAAVPEVMTPMAEILESCVTAVEALAADEQRRRGDKLAIPHRVRVAERARLGHSSRTKAPILDRRFGGDTRKWLNYLDSGMGRAGIEPATR